MWGLGATQWYRYRQLPKVLIIQLNRYDPLNGTRRSNAEVSTEEELDLAEYAEPAGQVAPGEIVEVPDEDPAPAAGGAENAEPAEQVAPAEPIELPEEGDASAPGGGNGRGEDARQTKYRLRAVVCHEGESTSEGHYTAWIRERPSQEGEEDGEEEAPRQAGWTHYDDTNVTPGHKNLPESVAQSGYLLFYEQSAAPAQKARPMIEGPLSPPEQAAPAEPSFGGEMECDEAPGRDVRMDDA